MLEVFKFDWIVYCRSRLLLMGCILSYVLPYFRSFGRIVHNFHSQIVFIH